jgi:AraC-like DNA-binding protein
MNDTGTHLAITAPEKRKLREAGIKVRDIHHHPVAELQNLLGVSKIRAMELFALSEFQSLPSIGVRFAHDLISMGYYSLSELKGKDGAKLTDKFERQSGVWMDPCLEDQFRLIVHYADQPGVHRNWWDFTTERKAFRAKKGYPASRPKRPWFELPRYQAQNRIEATRDSTKQDLSRRLRLSVRFMNQHLDAPVTLAELADISHLSSYHFLRCFKSAYDVTPFQFLTHLRLKKACKLLRETKLPLASLIERCGFENQSSFIRLFKKEFRVTPAAYRERKRTTAA